MEDEKAATTTLRTQLTQLKTAIQDLSSESQQLKDDWDARDTALQARQERVDSIRADQ